MILVTGGTGLLGAHLLYQLASTESNSIRAIYRKNTSKKNVEEVFSFYNPENYQQLLKKINWFEADILDIPMLSKAMENISYVYHCAGKVSFSPNDFEALIQTNIEGTANIVNLCLHFNVKKLCYVSSVATLTPVNQKVINEETDWDSAKETQGYAISKNGGEMEVWRGAQEGLSVVIVNPSVILGIGIEKSHSLFFEKINKYPYAPMGGTGFVSATDVACAMQLLMNSSVENERFILNSENLSFLKLFQLFSDNNYDLPKIKLLKNYILNIAWRIDGFLSFFGKKRFFTREMAKTLQRTTLYDGSKISKYIEFTYSPIKQVIKEIKESQKLRN